MSSMILVIVGGGRVGEELIKFAEGLNMDVRVIERKATRCAELSRKYTVRIYQGDAVESRILEAAGTGEADILIACTDDDKVNIAVSKLAKENFYVPFVVARTNSLMTPIDELSRYADAVVSQGEILAEALKRYLVGKTTDLLYDDRRIAIVRLDPPADSPLIGSNLGRYISAGELAIMEVSNGKLKPLDNKDTITYGKRYLIAGKRDTIFFLLSFTLPASLRSPESSGV